MRRTNPFYTSVLILGWSAGISLSLTAQTDFRRWEKQGWQHYFRGEAHQARAYFERSLGLNPANTTASLGLYFSSPDREFPRDSLGWLQDAPESPNAYYTYRDIVLWLVMERERQLADPEGLKRRQRDLYDEDYILHKAALTDSPFQVWSENNVLMLKGAFLNRAPSGTWEYYDSKGGLHRTIRYPESGTIVVVGYFKSDGVKVREDWIQGLPDADGRVVRRVIYWQENTGGQPRYLLVPGDGFPVIEDGRPVVLGTDTPDNIIEEVYNPEKQVSEAYIWRNGRRLPYPSCYPDGEITSEFTDRALRLYRWENCRKILLLE